jgi:hypothetical protein
VNHKAIIAVGGLLVCTVVPVAHAHISLERGMTHLSRNGDAANSLKDGPCGVAGAANQRGTHIYTYAPGETITVTFSEYIGHTSYFRFAFDDNGDDGFVDPVSIDPIDSTRGCPYTAAEAANDHCNASDFYNNATVLPDMDNLDPHITTFLGTKLWTYQVTLPNIECDNCTLQVIQVMEDPPGHGPFDGNADIYHQCIDLVLTNGGAGAGGAAGMSGAGGFGGAPAKKDSGCSVAGDPSIAATLGPMLFGLVGLARRRRSAAML